MRRLVDSILFLLVAYTVTWPIVRSFVAHPPRGTELIVEIRGECAANAELLVAPDATAARNEEWFSTIPMSSEGARLEQLGDRDQVWIAVRREGLVSRVHALEIDRTVKPSRLIVDLPLADTEAAPGESR